MSTEDNGPSVMPRPLSVVSLVVVDPGAVLALGFDRPEFVYRDRVCWSRAGSSVQMPITSHAAQVLARSGSFTVHTQTPSPCSFSQAVSSS